MTPASLLPRAATVRQRLRLIPTARWVTIAAVMMIVVQLVLRTVLVSRSWFLVDDFVFLSDIARGMDDFGWYTRIYQGHFMPLSFGLVKIGSFFGPWSWAAAGTEIIILQSLASIGCWLMLRSLFSSRPAILPALGFYLFSPLTMPTVMWWAVAINQLPHQIACFGAITAHVMFLRSRRWAPALVATAFLAVGYGSYTKTLLLPVVLAVLTMAYFASGSLPVRAWSAVRGYWRAWLLYGLLTTGFVFIYLGSAPATIPRTNASLAELTETSVLESFGSTLAGGPWRWTPFGQGPISYGAAPELGVVLAWLMITAFVVWAWARSERTLRVLWVPAIYIAASVALVFEGRAYYLSILGSGQVGRQVQYFSDAAPVIALSIGCMTVPILGAIEPVRRRALDLIDISLWRHAGPVLTGVLMTSLLASSTVSSFRYAQPWTANYLERNFTTSAHDTIKREDPLLADAPIPTEVLGAWSGDRALIRSFFAPVNDLMRVTQTGNDLQVFAVDGTAVPADVDAGNRAELDQSRSCPVRISGHTRTIRLTPVLNIPLWMAIDYRSDSSGVIALTIGTERHEAPIQAGTHTLFVATESPYATLMVRPLVDQKLCVSAVRVGPLVARDGS